MDGLTPGEQALKDQIDRQWVFGKDGIPRRPDELPAKPLPPAKPTCSRKTKADRGPAAKTARTVTIVLDYDEANPTADLDGPLSMSNIEGLYDIEGLAREVSQIVVRNHGKVLYTIPIRK